MALLSAALCRAPGRKPGPRPEKTNDELQGSPGAERTSTPGRRQQLLYCDSRALLRWPWLPAHPPSPKSGGGRGQGEVPWFAIRLRGRGMRWDFLLHNGGSTHAGLFPHVRKPWGKNPPQRRPRGFASFVSKLFYPGGGTQRSPRVPSRRGNHAGTPKHSAVFAAPFVNFRRSFSAVAAMAQALEIHAINEQPPISTVIHDMIHICCPSPDPTLRTRTTPWLMQKLRWSQILEPNISAIHPAPRLGRLTAPVTAGFMLVTVSGRSQRMASGMAAQPHRFV